MQPWRGDIRGRGDIRSNPSKHQTLVLRHKDQLQPLSVKHFPVLRNQQTLLSPHPMVSARADPAEQPAKSKTQGLDALERIKSHPDSTGVIYRASSVVHNQFVHHFSTNLFLGPHEIPADPSLDLGRAWNGWKDHVLCWSLNSLRG